MKYIRRKWLTQGNHSSSFVMCHYDPDCLNPEYENFIRIGDCNESVTITSSSSKTGVRRLINIIYNIILVINGQKRSYTLRKGKFKYRVFRRTIKLSDPFYNVEYLNIGRTKLGNKLNIVVNLHKDVLTCDQKEWENKLSLLKTELVTFKNFLSQLNGEYDASSRCSRYHRSGSSES